MSTHTIVLSACHERTELDLNLTAEQAKQLRALAALLRRAGRSSCQPKLRVYDEAGVA